jgi:hypothetical protein
MVGNYRVATQLVASREVLGSIELVFARALYSHLVPILQQKAAAAVYTIQTRILELQQNLGSGSD